MGPQIRHDGKHAEGMIETFREWLDSTYSAMHRMVIYRGTREFVKHQGQNMMDILDEQLHTMELCIYHGIKVQVEG